MDDARGDERGAQQVEPARVRTVQLDQRQQDQRKGDVLGPVRVAANGDRQVPIGAVVERDSRLEPVSAHHEL